MSTFLGSIRARLLAGFGALACIVAGAGAASHMQVGSMDESSRGLARDAALAEAAVEMEYLVARQMQMLMEMLVSRTQDELQAAWPSTRGSIRATVS